MVIGVLIIKVFVGLCVIAVLYNQKEKNHVGLTLNSGDEDKMSQRVIAGYSRCIFTYVCVSHFCMWQNLGKKNIIYLKLCVNVSVWGVCLFYYKAREGLMFIQIEYVCFIISVLPCTNTKFWTLKDWKIRRCYHFHQGALGGYESEILYIAALKIIFVLRDPRVY